MLAPKHQAHAQGQPFQSTPAIVYNNTITATTPNNPIAPMPNNPPLPSPIPIAPLVSLVPLVPLPASTVAVGAGGGGGTCAFVAVSVGLPDTELTATVLLFTTEAVGAPLWPETGVPLADDDDEGIGGSTPLGADAAGVGPASC